MKPDSYEKFHFKNWINIFFNYIQRKFISLGTLQCNLVLLYCNSCQVTQEIILWKKHNTAINLNNIEKKIS